MACDGPYLRLNSPECIPSVMKCLRSSMVLTLLGQKSLGRSSMGTCDTGHMTGSSGILCGPSKEIRSIGEESGVWASSAGLGDARPSCGSFGTTVTESWPNVTCLSLGESGCGSRIAAMASSRPGTGSRYGGIFGSIMCASSWPGNTEGTASIWFRACAGKPVMILIACSACSRVTGLK